MLHVLDHGAITFFHLWLPKMRLLTGIDDQSVSQREGISRRNLETTRSHE
jgi:hypothetical protein